MMRIEKIHEDERGKIIVILIGEQEYLLLETLEGKMRGGDYHDSIQHEKVLWGEIDWISKPDQTCEVKHNILKKGDEIATPPGIPHMMVSRGYSVILEWLDGKFEKTYYPPFRKLVEASK